MEQHSAQCRRYRHSLIRSLGKFKFNLLLYFWKINALGELKDVI
jgi:hypothetical protein